MKSGVRKITSEPSFYGIGLNEKETRVYSTTNNGVEVSSLLSFPEERRI